MQLLIASINTVNALYINEFASGRFVRDINSAINTWQALADRNQREFSEIWQSIKPHLYNAIRFTARVSAHAAHWYNSDRPVQLQSFLTWLAATYAWFVNELPVVEEIYTELDEFSCDLWELVEVQPVAAAIAQPITYYPVLLLSPAKEEPQPIKRKRGRPRKSTLR